MNASRRRVFYYHADAAPIGGHFTKPEAKILHSHGSSSLAQGGGHIAARASNFKLDKLVSFDEAYSEIHGEVSKSGTWMTRVTSVVEGLNILDTVKADRMCAVLEVEHPADGRHPKASIVESEFTNFSIDGVTINPVVYKKAIPRHKKGVFPEYSLMDDEDYLARAIEQSKQFTDGADTPDWLRKRYRWVQSKRARKEKGYVQCSLVDKLQGAKPGSSFGHVVVVPDFGNIFLGELAVDHHAFRLTLARVEMGCDNDGTVSIVGGNSNGSTMP
jgi:hypothetical protein